MSVRELTNSFELRSKKHLDLPRTKPHRLSYSPWPSCNLHGGIGRTGTVVCCWLLRHGHATKDNVFDVLAMLRKADTERAWLAAPENDTQKQFVLNWPEGLKRSKTIKPRTVALRNDWFTKLTGFSERSPEEVRECIEVREGQLT
jgi:hypothetical protein